MKINVIVAENFRSRLMRKIKFARLCVYPQAGHLAELGDFCIL